MEHRQHKDSFAKVAEVKHERESLKQRLLNVVVHLRKTLRHGAGII